MKELENAQKAKQESEACCKQHMEVLKAKDAHITQMSSQLAAQEKQGKYAQLTAEAAQKLRKLQDENVSLTQQVQVGKEQID